MTDKHFRDLSISYLSISIVILEVDIRNDIRIDNASDFCPVLT